MAILARGANKRIDDYWDSVVRGAPTDPTGIDPGLVATIHGLAAQGNQTLTVPLPASQRVWRRILDHSFTTSALLPRSRLSIRQLAGEWPTAALLVLTLVGGLFAYSVGGRLEQVQPGEPVRLYLIGEPSNLARPIDPVTLQDQPESPMLTLASPETNAKDAGDNTSRAFYQEWHVSADGSTAVRIDYLGGDHAGRDVSVRDGVDGPERSHFQPSGELGSQIPIGGIRTTMLSADGSRIVLVSELTGRDQSDSSVGVDWSVYDSNDGRLIASVQSFDPGAASLFHRAAIDPAASRLYQLVYAGELGPVGPFPVQLVVHDLMTGAEVARLDLTGVIAGEWNADGTVPSQLLFYDSSLAPATAMSPDGRQLAIVHGDGLTLTVVDTGRLVAASTPLSMPLTDYRESLTDESDNAETSDAPIYPQVRIASTTWEAVYSADGESLLVSGDEFSVNSDRRPNAWSFGLQRVVIATGNVAARTGNFALGSHLWPTADGQSIYVTRWTRLGEQPGPDTILLRLDPVTLDSHAERPMIGAVDVILWPRVPGSELTIVTFYHQP